MRFLLFSLAAGCLLLPACSFRSDSSSTDVAPLAPAPIPDLPSAHAEPQVTNERDIQAVEPAETTAVEPPQAPEQTLDPAPAPPEYPVLPFEETASETPSAKDVFGSVARVLREAVEGSDAPDGEDSQGSVLRSIGSALSKGFQEASAAGSGAND